MPFHGDCLEVLKTLPSDSVDLVCTDPPYGYSFMGKEWDKALPSTETWKECLRVLKPGGFAFVMSAPRSDVLSRMIVRIEDAGFRVDFTPIYWTYASGFPKAMNIGKMVDKRRADDPRPVCRWLRAEMDKRGLKSRDIAPTFKSDPRLIDHWAARDTDSQPTTPTWEQWLELKKLLTLSEEMDAEVWRLNGRKGEPSDYWKTAEIVGKHKGDAGGFGEYRMVGDQKIRAMSSQAKALDGSYGGFQPKPAVEVIIVAMKPLSEKTYVDQALKNGKGVTWLDDARIPASKEDMGDPNRFLSGKPIRSDTTYAQDEYSKTMVRNTPVDFSKGRFPANLLVQDDVLNDGVERKSTVGNKSNRSSNEWEGGPLRPIQGIQGFADTGSYSRYFDLDAWAANLPDRVRKTLPFLIVPKASKREKNEGLDGFPTKTLKHLSGGDYAGNPNRDDVYKNGTPTKNGHPTVKPLQLMAYLITLGSRPGDTVLDPFAGSFTTGCAAKLLGRNFICIEREEEYFEIGKARLAATDQALF